MALSSFLFQISVTVSFADGRANTGADGGCAMTDAQPPQRDRPETQQLTSPAVRHELRNNSEEVYDDVRGPREEPIYINEQSGESIYVNQCPEERIYHSLEAERCHLNFKRK